MAIDKETSSVMCWVGDQCQKIIESGRPIRGAVLLLIDESGDAYCTSRIRGSFRYIAIGALAELQHSLIVDQGDVVKRHEEEEPNANPGNRPE